MARVNVAGSRDKTWHVDLWMVEANHCLTVGMAVKFKCCWVLEIVEWDWVAGIAEGRATLSSAGSKGYILARDWPVAVGLYCACMLGSRCLNSLTCFVQTLEVHKVVQLPWFLFNDSCQLIVTHVCRSIKNVGNSICLNHSPLMFAIVCSPLSFNAWRQFSIYRSPPSQCSPSCKEEKTVSSRSSSVSIQI